MLLKDLILTLPPYQIGKNNKIPSAYSNKIFNLVQETSSNKIINNQKLKWSTNNASYKILIIISGGVASYKSLDLIRIFKKANIDVDVILTKSAQKFINPLLITSLNGKKCFIELFSEEDEENMSHIKLARQNDLIVVVPTTANFMAKIAHGLADDLATNIILATSNKIILAPSMNPMMWSNPATQNNIQILKNRGIEFIQPDDGYMACGEEGTGRLPEVETISKYIFNQLFGTNKNNLVSRKKLKNLSVMITAGPTQENIDPIIFISNSSSGKQGYAIAEECKKIGAKVILVSGPTNLQEPTVHKLINVKGAEEMLEAVIQNLPVDVFISTAAVCDWKLQAFDIKNNKIDSDKKIKKNLFNKGNLIFKIKENPDILKLVSYHKLRPKLVVGFAAETDNLTKNAKLKLKNKKLDLIVANKITNNNIVFGMDVNSVNIIDKDTQEEYINKSKVEVAKIIIKKVLKNLI